MLIRRGNSLAETARKNRQEIIAAGLSRREMFKLGQHFDDFEEDTGATSGPAGGRPDHGATDGTSRAKKCDAQRSHGIVAA